MTLNSYFALNSGYPMRMKYFRRCLLTELFVCGAWLPIYRVGQKKVSLFIVAITLLLLTDFHNFWYIMQTAYILPTKGYVVSTSNTVHVTTIPCKILIKTLALFVHVYYHLYIANKSLLYIRFMSVTTQITTCY